MWRPGVSGHEAGVVERADELRQAFDHSFALAPASQTDTAIVQTLLTVRVGSQPYAVRLAELSGLYVDKPVTWLPGPVPELLGVAGLRGTILPVYDLGMLLGRPRAATPRWLLMTAGTPVGLAVEDFDGYLSVRLEAIVPEVRAEARQRHVREVVRTADLVLPLVSLASVLESITNRAAADDPDREQ
ncbi:MAG: chemotaxis protein CheW [Luteitalea sp.]|nr:chemotaxis protein CheW [Luteitalea sp.]